MNGKLILTGICALTIGLAINNFAVSDALPNYKIATVDVQKVVGSSKAVNNLKAEHKKQIEDLTKFVVTAKTNLDKETDVNKRKSLETKYNKQLNDKKEAIDKNYAKKLAEIDKDISTVIQKEAKAKGFDIVLAKGIVLYGGEDITNEITKAVK